MREIKFRAWDKEQKVIIDGDSLAFEEYAPIKDLLSQDGIMQFTGLTDKNHNELYDQDLVKTDKGEILLVVWNALGVGSWWFARVYEDGTREHVSQIDLDKLELVGNIYENPELLEGENS